MADVENMLPATSEGGDANIDDGEEAESKVCATPAVKCSEFSFVFKEIMLMKQRVAEMEKEAKKLRELQAAAEEANSAVGSQDAAMETEEDKTVADSRSIYVGNSSLPPKMRNVCMRAMRPMSTAARATAQKAKVPDYPFSKTAIIPAAPSSPPPKPLLQGKGLMQHLNKTLATPEKQEMFQKFFDRHSPNQIRPGSIIQLTLEHAPTTFTGVLLSIRRRGLDTSILLRNIIQRTGVEMQFFVNSPHVKDIKVLQNPPGGRMRRAKLFYLRDSPEKMSMIAGGRK
ncbi:hypothetical protein C0993_004066 [Termitomyces sp. T159_Od127]|nr:hypothetical protein C0993_004066 [Termitomyces sp. T159_Od127]